MIPTIRRILTLLTATLLLSNCAALTSVENASRALNVYELRPVTYDPSNRARGSRSLLVESPVASGTLSTDRIVVRPSELEVKYLPGARWTEEAPTHFQRLMATSLSNTGRFGLVALNDAGISPDYVLLSNLGAFHATVAPGGSSIDVSVEVTLTIVRDDDQSLIGTRTFSSTTTSASDDPSMLIPAFDAGVQEVLHDALEWVVARTR